ncbi:MAG: hypothetical protein AAF685_05615 [Cyanobacteria bacterium P01_C01_bin.89]
MSAKILEGAIGKVADRWLPNLLGSPLLFWGGALILHVYSSDGGGSEFSKWFTALPEISQIIAVALGLGLAIASDSIVQQIELPVLRLLEGYWPQWCDRPRRWKIHRVAERQAQVLKRLQQIRIAALQNKSDPYDFEKQIALEEKLRELPTNFESAPVNRYLMPTRLGNILRAYERKPAEKYGLDAVVCWPRLWLLLPDPVKIDIGASRSELNAAVRLVIWGILFTVWTIWTHWWALVVGAITAWLAYRWAINAAQAYGILIESAFDTHRHLLYTALRFSPPTPGPQERASGQQLTYYLRNKPFTAAK